jgi:hypothetical protein
MENDFGVEERLWHIVENIQNHQGVAQDFSCSQMVTLTQSMVLQP